MDPFFPEFWFDARCLWTIWRRVLIPMFLLHTEWIVSDENLETHNPIEQTPSISQLILLHLSSTFCWVFPLLQHVGNGMCRHVLSPCAHSFFRLVILTHGRMPQLTWRIFTRTWIGMEFQSYPVSFPYYCSRSVLTFERDAREDDLLFRLWLCPLFPESCVSWLKLHESPLEHCPCTFTENALPFSSQRRLSFLWPDPLSTTTLRSVKFRVVIIWSTWSFTPVFNCWSFASVLVDHVLPTQSEVEQNSPILTCTILPRRHFTHS